MQRGILSTRQIIIIIVVIVIIIIGLATYDKEKNEVFKRGKEFCLLVKQCLMLET